MQTLTLFSGKANPILAADIARALGIPLGACRHQTFPDGEQHVELGQSVRGHDVYLVQPTSPPASDHLVEMLLMVDACRRSGAAAITAIVPYFGYARQDRRVEPREPIAARVMADVLSRSGIDRVVLVDLHTPATEAFFSVPAEHLTAVPLLARAFPRIPADSVIVAPDLGAVKLAEQYAALLDRPVATVHKIRSGPEAVQVRQIVGDVRGRRPLIVDDMISTGHTIAAATRALLAAGCQPDVTVAVSHGLFVGAERVLGNLPIGRIVTTDSVPAQVELALPTELVSLGPLLSDVVLRLHEHVSLADVVARR